MSIEERMKKVEELKETMRKDELALTHSTGKYEDEVKELLKEIGIQDQFKIFDLVKKSYEKGKGIKSD